MKESPNSDENQADRNEFSKFETIKKEILTKRKSLKESEYLKLSEEAYLRFIQSNFFIQANHILIFYSKRSAGEIDTVAIIKTALNQSKRISLPKTDLKNKQLQIYEIKDVDTDLEMGAYEIMEPIPIRCKESTFSEDIDLIIVPGTLFDKYGGRWGYGAGYYDRFLSKYAEILSIKNKKMPPIIGLAFDFQVIDGKLPQKLTDVRINGVITDKAEYYDRS